MAEAKTVKRSRSGQERVKGADAAKPLLPQAKKHIAKVKSAGQNPHNIVLPTGQKSVQKEKSQQETGQERTKQAELAGLAAVGSLFAMPQDGFPPLVLASASPRRLQLLRQIGVVPQHIHAPNIDETPQNKEHPRNLAKRLAQQKAEAAQIVVRSVPGLENAMILAADTVVAAGRMALPKAETEDEARDCLELLSGRAHRVYTAMSLVRADNKIISRLSETRVRFARLRRQTLEAYLASQEWQGKAGGYAIQGRAGSFVVRLVGSYSGVMGLDIAMVYDLFSAQNYPLFKAWQKSTL